MNVAINLNFWLFFVYFLIASFISFYIPGSFFVKKIQISKFNKFVLAIIIGMSFFVWQAYVFSYLGVRWVSYLYVGIFLLIWIRNNYKYTSYLFNKKLLTKRNSIDFLLILIIIFGIIFQLIGIWFSGMSLNGGMTFCCGHDPDNILYASVVYEIIRNFPPYEPGMYFQVIQNYHYLGHVIPAELIRIFNLPLLPTVFQYFTLFLSTMLGLSSIVVAQLLGMKKTFTRWFVFFIYFGGDLAYLVLFILGKGLDFNMHSLENGSMFLLNMPRAFSIIMFLGILCLLILWVKKKNIFLGILLAICASELIGFKVYTGIFAALGFFALAIYFVYKKNFKMLIPIAIFYIGSAIVYFPVNSKAGGLFFSGFWRVNDLIVLPELGLSRLELARRIYTENNNYIKVFAYELFFLLLYLFITFGTKLFGLVQSKKSLSFWPIEIHIFLVSGLASSTILGLFFLQTTGGSNSFNFLVSVIIISSLYAALSCWHFISKVKNFAKYLIILLIVLLTASPVLNMGFENFYLLRSSQPAISNQELQALSFLKKQKNSGKGLVVSNIGSAVEYPYINFLSDKLLFFSGRELELIQHGINYIPREKSTQIIFNSTSSAEIIKELSRNNIEYLYMSSKSNLRSRDTFFVKTLFDNSVIKILRYEK